MKTDRMKKLIAAAICSSMIFAISSAQALEVKHEVKAPITTYALTELPQNTQALLAENPKAVSVDIDEDLYTITTNNKDGSKTATLYAVPVKYRNKSGEVEMIDTSIVSNGLLETVFQGYPYKNKANSITTEFSKNADKGLRMTSENVTLKLKPLSPQTLQRASVSRAKITAKVEERQPNTDLDDAFVYENAFGADTALKYSNTGTGVEQEIILYENTGQTRFDFELDTGGDIAVLNEESGKIDVYGKENPDAVKYRLGLPYAYDSVQLPEHPATVQPIGTGAAEPVPESSFRHNNFDCAYELTALEDSKYRVTVTVPEEWLNDPQVIYPVVLASSVPVDNRQTSIDDTYALETSPKTNFYLKDRVLFGNYNGGKAYSYLRFYNLPALGNGEVAVTNAQLTLFITNGTTTAQNLTAYRIDKAWEGKTLTWNNRPTNMESIQYEYGHKNFKTYTLDVSSIVGRWYHGSPNYGLLLNYGHPDINDYNAVYSSDCGDANKRPKLVIDYEPLQRVSNGTYFVRNNRSGKYLDVHNAGTALMTDVLQYQFRGGLNQQWGITHVGGGWYTLKPKHTSGMALDVHNAAPYNDTNVFQYTANGGRHQQFGFVKNANGSYRIVTKNTGGAKCLAVKGALTDNLTSVIQYTYGKQQNDEWWVIPTTVPEDKICFEMGIYATDQKAYSSNSFGGHAFLSFKNITNQNVQFGPVFLKPNEEMTLTKWWQSDPLAGHTYAGIWYNRDTVIPDEELKKYYYLTTTIKGSALSLINDYCKIFDGYWLIEYNCCTLSTDIWNKFSDIELSGGFGDNPVTLMLQIQCLGGKTGKTFPLSKQVGYFNDTNRSFENVPVTQKQ